MPKKLRHADETIKYTNTDSDGERLYGRVRVERKNRNIPQSWRDHEFFYTRFDRVTINPTKFPVDLQGTFQQNSTSFTQLQNKYTYTYMLIRVYSVNIASIKEKLINMVRLASYQ